MDLANIAGSASDLTSQITAWAVVALPNFVAAILILLVGWWVSVRAESAVRHLLERNGDHVDRTLSGVLTRLVRYLIMIVVLVAALSQLGIETTSVLAALGAIGLAIGLALQGTLANIAAGIMLLWLRPFNVGDFIEADAQTGTVHEVGLFATSLITVEGLYVFVPNNELWNKRLINYSRMSRRMVREIFTISYDDDIQTARSVLEDMLADDKRIYEDPAPIIKVTELGDNAVCLELRAWTNSRGFIHTRWDVIEKGKTALEAAGLSIPYPQQDVYVKSIPASGGAAGTQS